MAEPAHPTMLPPDPSGGRDLLVDLLRSLATTTVVLWHWVFTILVWQSDGPHADNPIGYVSGLWCLTWVLQVMPLFFVAGGYTHALAWARHRGTPLHRRWGELVPLGLAAGAMAADVARFRYGWEQAALTNLVFVWAAAHQV